MRCGCGARTCHYRHTCGRSTTDDIDDVCAARPCAAAILRRHARVGMRARMFTRCRKAQVTVGPSPSNTKLYSAAESAEEAMIVEDILRQAGAEQHCGVRTKKKRSEPADTGVWPTTE
jgi:hypothetical protein